MMYAIVTHVWHSGVDTLITNHPAFAVKAGQILFKPTHNFKIFPTHQQPTGTVPVSTL